MSGGVDAAITDAINQAQIATESHQAVLTSGAGKAYQAVAASAALAIQDAVDSLRHTGTIAGSASGVALAQFIATGDPRFLGGLAEIQAMVEKATQNLAAVCAAAATAVQNFPAG